MTIATRGRTGEPLEEPPNESDRYCLHISLILFERMCYVICGLVLFRCLPHAHQKHFLWENYKYLTKRFQIRDG